MAHVSPIEVEKHLKGVSYPAKKQELVKHAQKQGADDDVLQALKDMREQNFSSPVEVSKAIGEVNHRS
jgi:hypothetical protein